MKTTLLHIILSTFLSIALVQCSPPKPIDTDVITPEELEMSMNTTETTSIEEATLIDETKPIEESAPIEKAAVIEKQKSISEPMISKKSIPVEKPKPIDKPLPVEKPIAIEKPIPVAEPVSFKSSGFSFKLLKANVQGTSTLHDWESQITKIDAKGAFQINDKSITAIQNAEIKISVKGIISKEGKKMDDKTYEAFNSEVNPYITYTFNNAEIKINANKAVSIETTGKLSMAGSSQQVLLIATGNQLPNGDLKLTVSKKIKMTDFNMEPPVMFLGTIKVGDEITVNFDFELSKLNQ